MVIYFGSYPLIINATVTNTLLFFIIFVFLFLLLYFVFINKKNSEDLIWILPASIIFIFIVRAIPNLLLMNPPLHDSYYYYVTTLNVFQYGTLDPVLKSWYPEIVQQLNWPALSLFTSFLSNSTNIDLFNISKFVVPFLGILYFGVIFIFAKTVSNDNRISFLTAILTITNNAVIYYQSEFHPQALASLILILMFFFYIKFKQSENGMIYGILMISMILVFLTCHHFSSIFISLIAILYILFIISLNVFKNRNKQIESVYSDLSKDFNLWIMIGVSTITYHVFVYFGFISALVIPLTENSPEFTFLMAGSSVPLYVTICNSTKYILLLLTIPAMYLILKTPNKYLKEFRVFAFFICFLAAGLISSVSINIPIDRIIYYALPFLAFLASFTVIKLYDSSLKNLFKIKKLNSKGIRLFIILILTIPMVGGFFGAQTPAYYFKETDSNTYYWYSNDPTIVNRFVSVGNWLHDYSNKKKYYATEFDTRSLVFYFAKVNRLSYYQKGIPDIFKGYVVVSPYLPHKYTDFNKTEYLDSIDLYYDDGKVIVGERT